MSFCTNCGSKADGQNFCTNCGAKIDIIEALQPRHRVKKTTVFISLFLIISLVLGSFLIFSGRSCKELVDDYMEATVECDIATMLSLFPEKLLKYIAEDEFDGDRQELTENFESTLSFAKRQLEMMQVDVSDISYKITDSSKMDDAQIERYTNMYSEAGIKIKSGKNIEVEIILPTSQGEQRTSTIIPAVKIGRSWYILDIM